MLHSEFMNKYYSDSVLPQNCRIKNICVFSIISDYKDPVLCIHVYNEDNTYFSRYFLSMIKPEVIVEDEMGRLLTAEDLDTLMEILTKDNNLTWKDLIDQMEYEYSMEEINMGYTYPDTPPDYRILVDPSLYHKDLAYLFRENYDEEVVTNCIDKYVSDFNLDLSKLHKDDVETFRKLILNTKLNKISFLYLSEIDFIRIDGGSERLILKIKDYDSDRIVYYNSINIQIYGANNHWNVFKMIEKAFGFKLPCFDPYEDLKEHHENIFKYRAKYLEEHGLKSDVDIIYKRGENK